MVDCLAESGSEPAVLLAVLALVLVGGGGALVLLARGRRAVGAGALALVMLLGLGAGQLGSATPASAAEGVCTPMATPAPSAPVAPVVPPVVVPVAPVPDLTLTEDSANGGAVWIVDDPTHLELSGGNWAQFAATLAALAAVDPAYARSADVTFFENEDPANTVTTPELTVDTLAQSISIGIDPFFEVYTGGGPYTLVLVYNYTLNGSPATTTVTIIAGAQLV